jgi:hypothetical protein
MKTKILENVPPVLRKRKCCDYPNVFLISGIPSKEISTFIKNLIEPD